MPPCGWFRAYLRIEVFLKSIRLKPSAGRGSAFTYQRDLMTKNPILPPGQNRYEPLRLHTLGEASIGGVHSTKKPHSQRDVDCGVVLVAGAGFEPTTSRL